MIAILGALEEEIRSLKKRMSVMKLSKYQHCRVYEGKYRGKQNLIILTGMGRERAQRAMGTVLREYPVTTILSIGFGGALNDKTVAGDIVVYSDVKCRQANGQQAFPNETLKSDPGLVSVAAAFRPGNDLRAMVGTGVTFSGVCAAPDAKYQLGRQTGADVVDMESYWIGQIAAGEKVPFLAVRSIFDAAADDLSLLGHIGSGGNVMPGKALAYFLAHPGHIKRLPYYFHNLMKAGNNLSLFLCGLLEII